MKWLSWCRNSRGLSLSLLLFILVVLSQCGGGNVGTGASYQGRALVDGTQDGVAGIRIVIEEANGDVVAVVDATGPDGSYQEIGRSPEGTSLTYTFEFPTGFVVTSLSFDPAIDPADVEIFEANFKVGLDNSVTPVQFAAIPRVPTPFPSAMATATPRSEPTSTPRAVVTPIPTATLSPSPSMTPTNVASVTPQPTEIPEATSTPTSTPTPILQPPA